MKLKYRNSDGSAIAMGSSVGTAGAGETIVDIAKAIPKMLWHWKYVGNQLVEKSQAEKDQADIDADPDKHEYISNPLKNLTPAQAETWIDNNVTDLLSAKIALKKMVRVIMYLVRRSNL